MRRSQGFYYRVARRGTPVRLETLLEHSFVVGFGSTQRVGAFELIPQCITDKFSRPFQTAVEKNCSRDCFKHVSQQGILMTPATLLFAASKTKEVAEVKFLRSLRECWGTDEAMLHA